MGNRWLRAAVVTVSAGALLLTGQQAAEASRPPVPVHAATRHPVTAPDLMRPGLVHLRNTGADPLMLVRKVHAGVKTLVSDLNENSASADVPGLFRHFRVIDFIGGRSDIYARLRPGTYYLVDAFAERYNSDDVHVISVQGAREDAKAPTTRAITIHAGTNVLTVPRFGHPGSFLHLRNKNSRMQELLVLRIKPSATRAQVAAVLAHPAPETLFSIVAPTLSSFLAPTITSGGEDLYLRLPHQTGRYFVIDLAIGKYASGAIRKDRIRLITLV